MRTAVILLAVAAISALIPAVRTARMRILDAIWGN
jgi:ABC-type antimicrobial peptide transport system permease subunit